MTTPVTGTSGLGGSFGIGSATTSLGQTQSASQDQNTFLKLLVAQLQYQDPASPADPTAFISEMAQFTQVQQMDEMTKATESVLSLQQGLAASALVGKTVQYTLADGTTGSGTALSASFGVASNAEPTVRVGTQDIPLSSITTVGEPRTT